MRFLGFIGLAVFIIWIWPFIFQKPAVDTPQIMASGNFTDVERQYYGQVFDYAMEVVAAGGAYNWETANGDGKILVSAKFKSKSDAQCRSFTELYTISGKDGTNEGIACKRVGRAGWCRLKKTDALTCAMEAPGNIVERAAQGTEDAVEAGKNVLGKAKGFFR